MSAALDIHNLRFRYNGSHATGSPDSPSGGEWTVDIARLQLDRGQQTLLTGTSGSGKSTLLHVIAGLLDPASGYVRINGQDIHALRGSVRDEFRGNNIGMIFQTFNLLHGFSALENVMAALMFADPKRFPRSSHAQRAGELLRELGIAKVNAQAHQMSVGQQQRVAVARAIACEPALVLADEPTASLDPGNAAAAMDLIQRTCAAHNAALLCVSHDPAMAGRFEFQHALDDLSGSDADE